MRQILYPLIILVFFSGCNSKTSQTGSEYPLKILEEVPSPSPDIGDFFEFVDVWIYYKKLDNIFKPVFELI
ncbi:hypothetical protein SAMN04487988_12132 [Algoriphagus hitonicola]|uniref:Lipoprotein n=1 Tax=Algoriphagus hitonicola TaxID=435880 RepID=A0A1I2XPM6_9BACT|nr:hypothetical protein SAMN04487988_12132 [Algoriphagus hitonicola]